MFSRHMRQKKRRKAAAFVTAFIMTAAFAISGAAQSAPVYADDEGDLEGILSGPASNASGGLGSSSENTAAVTKDETVYVITRADGTRKEAVVSEHLVNSDAKDNIHDKSDLKDIKNVKGDEKFTKETEDLLNWAADGSDIYYQGKTSRPLPVTLDISYYLNGEKISGKDIQGKSGDVKIVIKYKNHTKVTETVNGKTYEVCVPFVAMTGMILDNENFRSAEVSSGKVVDDGDRQVIIGTALPGMAESLDMEGSEDLPGQVEIKAYAEDFSLDYIMTMVTNDFFEDLDLSGLDTGSIDSKISSLDSAGSKLTSGSDTLARGLNKVYSSSGKMEGALSSLAKGAEKLKDGTKAAYKGSSKLSDGAGTFAGKVSELSDGLSAISSGSGDLSTGASSLYKSIRDQLKPSTAQLAAGAAGLDSGLSQIAGSIDKITGADSQALEYINAALKDPGLSEQSKAALQGAAQYIQGSIDGQSALKSQFTDGKTEGTVKNGTAALKAGTAQLDASIGKSGQKGTLADGAKKIADGASSLSTNLSTAAGGSSKLSEGADQLASSTEELTKGQKKLKEGAEELSGGASAINEGTPQLVKGLSKLAEGSKELSSGMSKFYQQGIKKLVDIYNGNIKGAAGKIQAMVNAAKQYNTFTRLADGMNGKVKFIYKTDPSAKDSSAKDTSAKDQ
ncbi:MAG: hypothetical protein IJF96_02460 [Firmicutes bacterium]|nr:hypothetical protein [Bacillota bacterium]